MSGFEKPVFPAVGQKCCGQRTTVLQFISNSETWALTTFKSETYKLTIMQRDPLKIQGPANRHQLRTRQFVIDQANGARPMDAVWRVVRYNLKGYTWAGPPYPSGIEFTELAHSWNSDWLAGAIERAKTLCRDTYRIGELYRSKNFEPVACREVVAEVSALYPEYSAKTIEDVISEGCTMAR